MANHVTKTRLAEIGGCSPATVTKLINNEFKHALHGERIDINDDIVQDWLKNQLLKPTVTNKNGSHLRGTAAAKHAKKFSKTSTMTEKQRMEHIHVDLHPFMDKSLRELSKMFGTDAMFQDWLKALKDLENIRAVQLKNAESEGLLVSREFVSRAMFSVIENTFKRLLSDAPPTIAIEIYGHFESGAPIDKAQESIKDILQTQLRDLKDKIVSSIQNMGSGDVS